MYCFNCMWIIINPFAYVCFVMNPTGLLHAHVPANADARCRKLKCRKHLCNFLCRLREEHTVSVAVATVFFAHFLNLRPRFCERHAASPRHGTPMKASSCTSRSGGRACASPSPATSPSQLTTHRHKQESVNSQSGGLYPHGERLEM